MGDDRPTQNARGRIKRGRENTGRIQRLGGYGGLIYKHKCRTRVTSGWIMGRGAFAYCFQIQPRSIEEWEKKSTRRESTCVECLCQ